MRIAVNSEEKSFSIRFPSFLLFNPIVATIGGSRLAKKYIFDDNMDIRISKKGVRKLFREINRARRKHKDWYIVEAMSGDDVGVKIKL